MISNSKKEEIKNEEDKNIQKLREEFDKRQSKNEHHPRTSHGYKRSTDRYNININQKNKYSRYNKAMSANRFKPKVKNNSNLNNKIIYDFCKKHPGYLYYKEVMLNNKNKKRSLTGKNKLPKIKNKEFNDMNEIVGKKTNYNHNHYSNNTNDKSNPYSFFWANRILNRNNFRIDIKGMTYGVPKLGSTNRKDDVLLKIFSNNFPKGNKNKKYNNFMNISNRKNNKKENLPNENKNIKNNNNKCYKINSNNDNNSDNKMKNIHDINGIDKKVENNNKNNEDNGNEVENESYDEEQQKQFYTNQKNFFKARKDIKEEPEYLEEDNEMNEDIEKDKE